MRWPPLSPPFFAAVLALAAAACEGERGEAAFGAPCARSGDCAEGLCVGGVDGEAPRCTRSCAGGGECPEGWSCSGVTAQQVLVCQRGGSTPFGD